MFRLRLQKKVGRRDRRRPKGQHGFSLIDVMVGVTLAVLALGGIFMTTLSAGKLRRVDRESNLAFNACRKRMEELRDVGYTSLAAQNATTFDVDLDSDGRIDLKPVMGAAKAGSVTITVQDAAGGDTLYKVVLRPRLAITKAGSAIMPHLSGAPD